MPDPVRVLLVDDEEDFAEAVGYWLTSRGHHVSKARDGEQALAMLKTGHFDVMFLDVMMPKLDGIETLRRLRSFNKTLPVILVTASNLTDENRYAGAKALGISGLFPKGTSLNQLNSALEVALRALKRAPAAPPAKPGFMGALRKALGSIFPSKPA
jgi:CheY-like chemotaxis protein